MPTEPFAGPFAGRRCLPPGGPGFIGSNLALTLARGGAEVTVLDARVPRHGANPANLIPDDAGPDGAGAAGDRAPDPSIAVIEADLGDVQRPDVRDASLAAEFVFNLAGQVSHVDLMDDRLFHLSVHTTRTIS